MAVFFAGEVGRVVAMQDPGMPVSVRALSVDGGAFGFAQFRAIVNRIMVSRQGNFQFMHTLGNGIYIYTFGDRIGQMVISGLAMQGYCNSLGQLGIALGSGGMTGIERVMAYYNANRIAARDSPITVTIGTSTTLVGYLGALQVDSGNPELGLYSFNLPLILLPES